MRRHASKASGECRAFLCCLRVRSVKRGVVCVNRGDAGRGTQTAGIVNLQHPAVYHSLASVGVYTREKRRSDTVFGQRPQCR